MIEIVCPTMPDWARPDVDDVLVRRWRKPDGAMLRADDIIVELETRPVNIEICAQAAGVLRIIVPQGARVRPGDVLGAIDDPNVGDNSVWPPPPMKR